MASFLVDTKILLRLSDPNATEHSSAIAEDQAVGVNRHDLFLETENMVEFWPAGTRPVTSTGALGWSPRELQYGRCPAEYQRRMKNIECFFPALLAPPGVFGIWIKLLSEAGYCGVPVDAARMAAVMRACGVAPPIALNPDNFRRKTRLIVVRPADASRPAP
jgi:hypothetical protein